MTPIPTFRLVPEDQYFALKFAYHEHTDSVREAIRLQIKRPIQVPLILSIYNKKRGPWSDILL